MTSRRYPFIVHLNGNRYVKFTSANDAQEYGQFYSERHDIFIEVEGPLGLIGQYKHGFPTPEFACRGDNWLPAGPPTGLSRGEVKFHG